MKKLAKKKKEHSISELKDLTLEEKIEVLKKRAKEREDTLKFIIEKRAKTWKIM